MNDPAAMPAATASLRRRHLQWGWWSLAGFLSLGLVLEALHGWKSDWYLAVGNETRRLLWRLGHAHGTFLGLVHLAYAASLGSCPTPPRFGSPALCAAGIALPAGFLLGGVDATGGDPGPGILLVPFGALLLLLAVVGMARAVRGSAS